jgi:hypothetical protein
MNHSLRYDSSREHVVSRRHAAGAKCCRTLPKEERRNRTVTQRSPGGTQPHRPATRAEWRTDNRFRPSVVPTCPVPPFPQA